MKKILETCPVCGGGLEKSFSDIQCEDCAFMCDEEELSSFYRLGQNESGMEVNI